MFTTLIIYFKNIFYKCRNIFLFFLPFMKNSNKSKISPGKKIYIKITAYVLLAITTIFVAFLVYGLKVAIIVTVSMFLFYFLLKLIKKRKRIRNNYKYLNSTFSDLAKRYKQLGKDIKTVPCILLIGDGVSGNESILHNPKLKLLKISNINQSKSDIDWYFSPDFFLLNIKINLCSKESYNTHSIEDSLSISSEIGYLLKLLSRKRKKAPINSMLITLPCDVIGKSNGDELSFYGTNITRFLKDIQTSLSTYFPVYLFISKSDMLAGFNEFFHLRDKKNPENFLGWSNPESFGNKLKFANLENDFELLTEDIRNKSISHISTTKPKEYGKNRIDDVALFYGFQWNFEIASKKVVKMLNIAFEKYNWVHGLPIIRGVYFAPSFHQPGSVDFYKSDICSNTSNSLSKFDLKDKFQSISQNFFKEKIFKEVHLVTPRLSKEYRIKIIRNIILSLVIFGSFSLLAFGSYKSYNTFEKESSRYYKTVIKRDLKISPAFLKKDDSAIEKSSENITTGKLKKLIMIKNENVATLKLNIPILFRQYSLVYDITTAAKEIEREIYNKLIINNYLTSIYNTFSSEKKACLTNNTEFVKYLKEYYLLKKIPVYLSPQKESTDKSQEQDASKIWFAIKLLDKGTKTKNVAVLTRTLEDLHLGSISTQSEKPLKFIFYMSSKELDYNKSKYILTIPQGWSLLYFLFDGPKYRPLGYSKEYWITWDKAENLPDSNIWLTKIKFISQNGKELYFSFKFQLPESFIGFSKLFEANTNKKTPVAKVEKLISVIGITDKKN
jgi:hypothetical protein